MTHLAQLPPVDVLYSWHPQSQLCVLLMGIIMNFTVQCFDRTYKSIWKRIAETKLVIWTIWHSPQNDTKCFRDLGDANPTHQDLCRKISDFASHVINESKPTITREIREKIEQMSLRFAHFFVNFAPLWIDQIFHVWTWYLRRARELAFSIQEFRVTLITELFDLKFNRLAVWAHCHFFLQSRFSWTHHKLGHYLNIVPHPPAHYFQTLSPGHHSTFELC